MSSTSLPSVLLATRYQSPLRAGSPPGDAFGSLLLAGGFNKHTLERRAFKYDFQQVRLFDPQLYLSGLDAATCGDAVAKLATYPWFRSRTVPSFDSGESTQAAWAKTHRAALLASWSQDSVLGSDHIGRASQKAVTFQLALGVARLILPAPLVTSSADPASLSAEWWDAALSSARLLGTGTPALATIAIADYLLRAQDGSAEIVLDQFVAAAAARRADLSGVYLVLEQSSVDEYSISDRRVINALLQLTQRLSAVGLEVVVGPSSMATFAMLGFGASAVATGFYRSLRRTRLGDFVDRQGMQYPRFASIELAGDVGLQSDVQAIAGSRYSSALSRTPESESLIAALVENRSGIPSEWEYSAGNTTASWSHYLWAIKYVAESLASDEPRQSAARWLARAAILSQQIRHLPTFGRRAGQSEVSHQQAWSQCIDELTSDRR